MHIHFTGVLQQSLGRVGPINDLNQLVQNHGDVRLHLHPWEEAVTHKHIRELQLTFMWPQIKWTWWNPPICMQISPMAQVALLQTEINSGFRFVPRIGMNSAARCEKQDLIRLYLKKSRWWEHYAYIVNACVWGRNRHWDNYQYTVWHEGSRP